MAKIKLRRPYAAKTMATAFVVVGVVASISFSMALYGMQTSKDTAAMMHDCLIAGGRWTSKHDTSRYWECVMPKDNPKPYFLK